MERETGNKGEEKEEKEGENEEMRRVHKILKVQISSFKTATGDTPELESGNER